MRYLIAFALLLLSTAAHASPEWHRCMSLGTLISAQTMESTRSLDSTTAVNWASVDRGPSIVVLTIQLTDANASITRFDTTCTVSRDGNVTDLTPQVETVVAGVATQVDAGVWQKASPGSKNWMTRFRVAGAHDFQCSFAVGSGTGAAADLLTVKADVCAQ